MYFSYKIEGSTMVYMQIYVSYLHSYFTSLLDLLDNSHFSFYMHVCVRIYIYA